MTASRIAAIARITGQDGAYLARLLPDKGYLVHGTYWRSSAVHFWRIDELGIRGHPNLRLAEFVLTDAGASLNLIARTRPDDVYNVAALSFVGRIPKRICSAIPKRPTSWWCRRWRWPRPLACATGGEVLPEDGSQLPVQHRRRVGQPGGHRRACQRDRPAAARRAAARGDGPSAISRPSRWYGRRRPSISKPVTSRSPNGL